MRNICLFILFALLFLSCQTRSFKNTEYTSALNPNSNVFILYNPQLHAESAKNLFQEFEIPEIIQSRIKTIIIEKINDENVFVIFGNFPKKDMNWWLKEIGWQENVADNFSIYNFNNGQKIFQNQDDIFYLTPNKITSIPINEDSKMNHQITELSSNQNQILGVFIKLSEEDPVSDFTLSLKEVSGEYDLLLTFQPREAQSLTRPGFRSLIRFVSLMFFEAFKRDEYEAEELDVLDGLAIIRAHYKKIDLNIQAFKELVQELKL